jgi:hypothetical protein
MFYDDWLACKDPEDLYGELIGRGLNDRRLRLFAVACLRRVWPLLPGESHRDAAEAHEAFAEGRLRLDDLVEACFKAEYETTERLWTGSLGPAPDTDWVCPCCEADGETHFRKSVALAVEDSHRLAAQAALNARQLAALHTRPLHREAAREAEGHAQYLLYKDIFDRPRQTAVDPLWLKRDGGTAARVARVLYERRRLAELPVLADALEEAGCDDAALLMHLRHPGTHVLGCWALDLVLGKE